MLSDLSFEKSVAELEAKAKELRAMASGDNKVDVTAESENLDQRAQELLKNIYKGLTPWQKCEVARHPKRPHCLNYVDAIFDEFTPLCGDRNFAEDMAVIGGLARLDDRPLVIIGHEKGHDTRTRLQRNFGMARPEGYRKAVRLMDLADRFNLPVVTLIDTAGAFPGKGAEERGQSEAIARSTEKQLQIGSPIVSLIIGEGGSGGAVAFATSDRLLMLEHSIYSVISPEGGASILWKDATKMRDAAEALHLTAQDMIKLGVADQIITEPIGGAHRDPNAVFEDVKSALIQELDSFDGKTKKEILASRRKRFLDMGQKGL